MDKRNGDGVETENFFTLGESASLEKLYLGRKKPLSVSQNYFQSRDIHFRFDRNHKYCPLNS